MPLKLANSSNKTASSEAHVFLVIFFSTMMRGTAERRSLFWALKPVQGERFTTLVSKLEAPASFPERSLRLSQRRLTPVPILSFKTVVA